MLLSERFIKAWNTHNISGRYQYGDDALEQVAYGYQIAEQQFESLIVENFLRHVNAMHIAIRVSRIHSIEKLICIRLFGCLDVYGNILPEDNIYAQRMCAVRRALGDVYLELNHDCH